MGISNWMNVWTAIFPIAVLLYYFFRKKYETITISSTLYWEHIDERNESLSLFEKLAT